MADRFNPEELRDPHGKWTRGGAVLERLSHEAASGSAVSQGKALESIRGIEPGKGKTVNSHWVDRPGEGYRVKLKKPGGDRGRDTKTYSSPEHAAQAVIEGKHHDEAGATPPPLGRPYGPIPGKAPAGIAWSGGWKPENEKVPGTREFTYNKLVGLGTSQHGAANMIAEAKLSGRSIAVDGLYVEYDKGSDKYLVKSAVRPGTAIREAREEIARNEEALRRSMAKPGGVAHPKSLQIAGSANRGRDDNKRMRQEVIKASTIQAQHTPRMVAQTEVTVTKAPHGKRGGTTLASHTGARNTLHIKPEVLVGSNAQQVLEANRGKWWVPADEHHNLATNVMIHEYGHGVHGMLFQRGIMKTNKLRPTTDDPEEQKFWQDFAAALNKEDAKSDRFHREIPGPEIEHVPVTRPKPGWTPESGGSSVDTRIEPQMNVGKWLFRSATSRAVERNVSKYATTNQNEMLAELWTEYKLSSTPRAPAKVFGDFVTKRIGSTG